MKKLTISCLFFVFLGLHVVFAQERCAMPHIQVASDLELKQLLAQKRSGFQGGLKISQDEIIKIPVVVHVIHNNTNGAIGGTTNTNISDEQIFSQIKVLNEDYRKVSNTPGFNSNPVGADMGIEFFLTTVDPDGNPTSGITRHFNAKRQWDILRDVNQIANISSWDSNRFLNIWVLDLTTTYLGYAEFPGAAIDGLELNDPNANSDGVFIDYSFFGRQIGTAVDGPYTYGRTATHEIGHWLGLIHIWGDTRCGDDYCLDTPIVENANLDVDCNAKFSRCSGASERAMIENYMDYTADQCMNIFTQDQKTRVRAVLELSQRRRRLVLNSQSFLPPSESLQVKLLNHPNTKDKLSMQILLPTFQDFNIQFFDILGHLVDEKSFKDFPSTIVQFQAFEKLKGGQLYIMRVSSNNDLITYRVALF